MIVFRKARTSRQTLNDLDAYLKTVGDEPARWLAREVQSWGEFSYSELENLIMTGGLNDLIDWQARWAEVINQRLALQWQSAMEVASKKATKGKVILDDSDVDVKNYLRTHGGELITVLTKESKAAVAMVILRGQAEKILPKKIAQQIRPLIGLNERQAQANMTYRERVYQNLLASGLPPVTAEARAAKAALRYAGKQHRERADMIVNTELAFAYNRGADIGVRRAIREGYMGRCEMVWTTAGTNRVCGRCLALKDTVVGHTDESGVTLPPLHPRCRCAIMYREVAVAEKPKDFKAEIANLRQELADKRARGATAAELEQTVKAAGKLVTDRVKAQKIFDLPPEQKINLPLLEKTLNDFSSRVFKMPTVPYAAFVEREELLIIRAKMFNEFWHFQIEAEKQTPIIQKGRAEQLKAILSEVRPMGATKEQLKAQFGTSKTGARKIFDVALNYYPTDWVEKSIKRGMLKAQKPKSGRAYYSGWRDLITVVPEEGCHIGTAIHELGHRMEDVEREILKSEREFYRRRTAGEKLESLRAVTGNRGYDASEMTRKDKFLNAYIGKDYGGSAFELVSMGFQWAYTDPAFLLQDEDMAEWILGILALI